MSESKSMITRQIHALNIIPIVDKQWQGQEFPLEIFVGISDIRTRNRATCDGKHTALSHISYVAPWKCVCGFRIRKQTPAH